MLRTTLAATSLGAGLIHIAAAFDHTDHPAVATFFVLLAAGQVGWAAVVVRRPTADLLKVGAVVSAGVVVIWLLSRTTGLAGVSGAEEVEAVGLQDSVATVLEVLLVLGVVARSAAFGSGLRTASGRLASGLAVSAVGVLTAAALAASGDGHHHGGTAYHHQGSEAAAAEHPHATGEHTAADAGRHGHPAAAAQDHRDAHHDEPAAPGHDHGAAGAVPVHGAGHDHSSSALASAAAAEHDHNAPGHVHDPAHHQHGAAPGSTEGWQHGTPNHEGAHNQGTPDHEAPHEPSNGGRQPHGGHGAEDTCGGPIPDVRLSRDIQEYATYYLGIDCLEPKRAD